MADDLDALLADIRQQALQDAHINPVTHTLNLVKAHWEGDREKYLNIIASQNQTIGNLVDELKKREVALNKLGQDFDGLLSLVGAIRGRAA